MANYPLMKVNKEGTLLRPQHSYHSDEYTDRMCQLHLSDHIVRDDNGKTHKHYRLHAKQMHNIEMALSYDIMCPNCGCGHLKQVGGCLNSHELGLYSCPLCEKR